MREQTHVATRTLGKPAEDEPAGTAGAPDVRTGTELTIRDLEVTALKAVGGQCEM